LAELGAFAALPEVAPSLLAILNDYYYARSSFVRNGPVKYLENNYGEEWIVSLDTTDLGIATDGALNSLNEIKFYESLTPIITSRLDKRRITQKFDPKNSGHAILLLTGLCQEIGALTITEIEKYFEYFEIADFTRKRISNYYYCAELLGWLRKIRKGHNIFYVATNENYALDFAFNDSVASRDKVRWRADIRAYWRQHDSPRIRAISEVLAPSEEAAE
jgi:hypothetical protein